MTLPWEAKSFPPCPLRTTGLIYVPCTELTLDIRQYSPWLGSLILLLAWKQGKQVMLSPEPPNANDNFKQDSAMPNYFHVYYSTFSTS